MKDSRGYTVSIDNVTKSDWSSLLRLFDDANLYQTWDYAQVVFSRQKPSRLAVYRGDEVVAMAQARMVTLPLVKRGVAHVAWGPLWQRAGRERDLGALDAVLEALQDEYVVKMRLALRITPGLPEEDDEALDVLLRRGYSKTSDKPYPTIMLDVARQPDEIRKGFSQKWRNHLKRAEKNDLAVEEGTAARLYEEFLGIYREMRLRKSFRAGTDPEEWRPLQEALPDGQKMTVLLARHNGRAVAGAVFSFMGERGRSLFRATSDEGMRSQGSYLLQWRAIAAMRERGCSVYDLGGIDPEGNPGVYHFKSRMGGKEVSFLGTFDCCESRISRAVVLSGQTLRRLKGALRRRGAS